MAENQVIDEVVTDRAPSPMRGRAARPVFEETIDSNTGAAKAAKGNTEDDSHSDGARVRVFSKSTEALLEKIEAEEKAALAPHEEGDADEDDPDEEQPIASHEEGDPDEEEANAQDAGEDVDDADKEADVDEEDPDEEQPDPAAEWQTKYTTLEARNRALLSELEEAHKTPKSKRTAREQSLLDAEAAYYDEGSVAAMRKFLSVITGAAHDSKEVDAELAGLYVDLSEREVGVPLSESQKALRDNARTRLLLARDKRDKAEGEKKAETDNGAGEAEVKYEDATKFIDNVLATKSQSGTSLADECPMLMDLAREFDGYSPGEVLARAIRKELLTGTLDMNVDDTEKVRIVATRIESYYDGLGKKINAALAKKTAKVKKSDTTTPSVKPKVKVDAGTESRKGQEARTITTKTASRAPAKLPKETKQKAASTTEKTRKDFKTDAAWREHLLNKHFQS